MSAGPAGALRIHHVRALLRGPGFARLLGVRLAGQFGDGVFQASLAGAVLFNPERQASAADVATGFAVLLLPWSLIGPFPGVLLDRWPRRDALTGANLLRAIGVLAMAAAIAAGVHGLPFYAGALVVLSISRFFLAGLSAGLPHVVDADELVTANALSTTAGGVTTTLGGAVAIGIKLLIGAHPTATYATIALIAALPYLACALLARRFGRWALGPDEQERTSGQTAKDVVSGLVAASRHLRQQRGPLLALAAIGMHRLCYGLFAVMTLLLFRNHYAPEGLARSGLAGLTQFVVLGGVGAALAAVATPALARRWGIVPVAATMLLVSAAVATGIVLPFRLPLHLLAAACLGFASQSIKVCIDTQVQRTVSDEFRGRVFALYDTVFNLALVLAAVIALALPPDGTSRAAVIGVAFGWAATALAWRRLDQRLAVNPAVVQPAGALGGAATMP